MKKIMLLFWLTLSIPCFAAQPPSQDKPQADTAPPAAKKITRVRMGGNVAAKRLVHRVQPEYPGGARQQRISGTVRLHAIIANDGSIGQLELVSGDPILARAALEAVRQWKYQPATINGDPVEVDTTIDVIFSLNQ
jgi:periplasmic protein TonB